jgi:hypothetical protein
MNTVRATFQLPIDRELRARSKELAQVVCRRLSNPDVLSTAIRSASNNNKYFSWWRLHFLDIAILLGQADVVFSRASA